MDFNEVDALIESAPETKDFKLIGGLIVNYKGVDFFRTGKTGTDRKTGAFCVELASEDDSERLWFDTETKAFTED